MQASARLQEEAVTLVQSGGLVNMLGGYQQAGHDCLCRLLRHALDERKSTLLFGTRLYKLGTSRESEQRTQINAKQPVRRADRPSN